MKNLLKILLFLSIAVICDLLPASCYPQSIMPAKDNSTNVTIFKGGVDVTKEFRVPRTKNIFATWGSFGAIYYDSADTHQMYFNDGADWIPFGGSTGSGTVANVSITTANGISGAVANPTTTPAITLSLGAITPTSVNASGTVLGSNISGTTSGTNTGDQTSVTGNAGTATKLLTARTIDGVSFDGSANITIPLTSVGSGDVTWSTSGTNTLSPVTTLKNTGTPGTYGSASTVPVITTDAQGRVSSVTTTTINATPSGSAGGDLSGTYPNPLIGNSTITTSKINATGSPSSSTFYRGDGSWSIPDYSKLIPTGVKTTTYAANPSDLVQLNPNPSSFISTLPDNPADKTLIGFDLVDTLGANTVTVNTQGIDVINRAGGSTSYILSVRSEGVIFQYVSSTHIWLFYAAHFPRGNMIKLGDAAGGILSGTYPNPTIVTGAVSNAMLTNSFVTLNGTSVALGASGTIPDNITNTTSNTTYYPTFVSTASGNQSLQTASAAITYNPSTGALTTASFVGTLNGNAATSTTATNLASITTGTYTPSVNGLTPATIDHADYILIGGHLLFLDVYFYGPAISSNTILSFTLPNGLTAQTQSVFYANSMSNGAHGNGACITSVGSNTVSVSASGAITGTVTLSPVGFSSTGTKGVATSFQLFVNGTLVLALLVLITEVTIFFNNKNS